MCSRFEVCRRQLTSRSRARSVFSLCGRSLPLVAIAPTACIRGVPKGSCSYRVRCGSLGRVRLPFDLRILAPFQPNMALASWTDIFTVYRFEGSATKTLGNENRQFLHIETLVGHSWCENSLLDRRLQNRQIRRAKEINCLAKATLYRGRDCCSPSTLVRFLVGGLRTIGRFRNPNRCW